MRPAGKPTAFTLIELLVVISVITLLISISLPSLSQARRYAKQVTCSTRLKADIAGWRMYLDDNPGHIPLAISLPIEPQDYPYMQAMGKYVTDRETWHCPSDDRNYFANYGTSYEYAPGWMIPGLLASLEPDEQVSIVEEFILESLESNPEIAVIFLDAEFFHPSRSEPYRKLSAFHDGHVDWLDDDS